jgi:prepilin-type N-terminal cleavage/methylation domain-containing protein
MKSAHLTTSVRRTNTVTRRGFTLVELLTVIAIIALLAAILLPVFAAVRENARRAACMSNMREIGAAVRFYELDNRKYPDYLLGPALNAADGTIKITTGNDAMNLQQVAGLLAKGSTADPVARNAQFAYAQALYPTYVKDLNTFHCPNNTEFDTARTTDAVQVTRLERNPTDRTATISTTPAFYRFDSYDANPALVADGGNGFKKSPTYAARYSRVWQPLLNRADLQALRNSSDPALTERYNAFRRQLLFKNPTTDTYVTMCTHHADKGKVIVLWLNGTAKVMDSAKLRQAAFTGTDGRDVDAHILTPTNY